MMTKVVEVCLYSQPSLSSFSFFSLDINECLLHPCPKTMTCENTPGSFRCVEGCESGYIWSTKHGQCRGNYSFDLFFGELVCIRY
jgi:hypothetical protein